MAPRTKYRKCVVCEKRCFRQNGDKRKFMAKFPLDEDLCRQWVKNIGNEDFAYIPIEKLHDSKYVCGDHFQSNDFNKKKSRLKKWAVPSILINMPSLSDHLLAEFPCHIAKSPTSSSAVTISTPVLDATRHDHNYLHFQDTSQHYLASRKMAAHQSTSRHVKQEVLEVEFVEVESQDARLCTACLCATRTTRTLDDGALKQYYMHILAEMQKEGGVFISRTPTLCWECMSHLKRSVRFREQVQDSYRLLQPMLSGDNKQDLNEFLQKPACRPGRLQTSSIYSIEISPKCDDAQVMSVAKHDDDDDDDDSKDHSPLPLMKDETDARIDDPCLPQNIETNVAKKPFQCDVCRKGFSQRGSLNIHIRTHTGEKPYQCEVCMKSFSRKNYLVSHSRTHSGEKPFQCKMCIQSFSRKPNLLRHLRTHTGEKPFQCKICHKSFTQKTSLVTHVRSHGESPPFQCDVCGKVFTLKHSLIVHLRTHTDTGEKPFQREVCHKSFSQKSSLLIHYKNHNGKKPFQCDVCQKSFARKQTLVVHIRTHTNEKPYQCEVCYKSFSCIPTYIYHKRTHTGEKPYQCEMCHKTFAQNQQLLNHLRTHTGEKPFQCEVCHKTFTQKPHLVSHSRIHTGEKPYECEVCHKSFSHKNNMQSHLKTHSGEKPFQCQVCHKSFFENRYMLKHLKTCVT